ncbi:MAG TPA: tetratricopeptide repeat protein [Haliangiales bacterium]|nr:tetratricopeptide repeat protein [Haliangiales bacterium]
MPRRLSTSGEPFAVRGQVSPLVGRDAELKTLAALLDRARSYHAPQVVVLVGNQGTGKTRLAHEFVAAVTEPTRVFEGSATSPGARYSAILRVLRARIGIAENDDSEEARARFRDVVQVAFGDRRVDEVVHFLGTFIGFRYAESPFLRAFEDNPRQHDEIARALLRRFLELDAQASPLVLILDDLHLADDDTLGVLEELGESLSGSSVMLVLGARPDLLIRRPHFGEHAGDATRLELRNLEPPLAALVFRNLLRRAEHVPVSLVEDAVEMTGGNPFFLEELVRVFLANGTIDASGPTWRIDADRAGETELPITVEEAIEARIAALDPDARDLLERGAVFGNVFWVNAIAAMARLDREPKVERGKPPPVPPPEGWADDGMRAEVLRRVERLVERDYLLMLPPEDSSIPGETEVVFKHNLERDLVWRMTDADKRQRWHRIAAQWLEVKFVERSEVELEFLAQLYERGDDPRRAAAAYLAAGDKARARFANAPAVDLYRRALALHQFDDVAARLDTLHNLGTVLALVGKTDEAAAQFGEMLRLAWLYDHPAKGGAAYGRIGRIHRQRGDYDRALSHFKLAHDLHSRAGDERGVAGALDDAGIVYWLRGDYPRALERSTRALELRRRIGDKRSIALSLANIGRVLNDSGQFPAALERFREALELRREIGDRAGMVQSMCDLAQVLEADGKLDAALEHLGDALKMARDIGDRFGQAHVLGRQGETLLLRGRTDKAIEALSQAAELATALGDRLGLAAHARRLAEAHLVVGQRERALAEARRALDLAEKLRSRAHVGGAQRVLAEVLSAGHDPEAGAWFERAIQTLEEVRNEIELARCYRAFAAFRERAGDVGEAVRLRMRADEIFARVRGAHITP